MKEMNYEDFVKAAKNAFKDVGLDKDRLKRMADKVGMDLEKVGSGKAFMEDIAKDYAKAAAPFVDALKRHAPGKELVLIYFGIVSKLNDTPRTRLVRHLLLTKRAVPLLRSFVLDKVLGGVTDVDPLKAQIALTQIVGLGLGRYIAELPALKKASAEEIAGLVGPVIDAYLKPAKKAPAKKAPAKKPAAKSAKTVKAAAKTVAKTAAKPAAKPAVKAIVAKTTPVGKPAVKAIIAKTTPAAKPAGH